MQEGRKPGRYVAGSSVNCFLVSCLPAFLKLNLGCSQASIHRRWSCRIGEIRPLVPAGGRDSRLCGSNVVACVVVALCKSQFVPDDKCVEAIGSVDLRSSAKSADTP